MNLQLMLACNDPATGTHTGQVDQIEISDYILQAEGPPISCSHPEPGKLELADHIYDAKSYGEWAGNWCWDCATLPSAAVARILERLREMGWAIIEAETSLFEKWQSGERILAEDLERLAAEAATICTVKMKEVTP